MLKCYKNDHLAISTHTIAREGTVLRLQLAKYNITIWKGGIGQTELNPAYGREVNSMFLDTVDDFELEQQVYKYTRGNHILHIKYHLSNTDLETLTLSHFVKTIIVLYISVKTLLINK